MPQTGAVANLFGIKFFISRIFEFYDTRREYANRVARAQVDAKLATKERQYKQCTIIRQA